MYYPIVWIQGQRLIEEMQYNPTLFVISWCQLTVIYYVCLFSLFILYSISPLSFTSSVTSNNSWYGVGIYFSGNETGDDTANVYYLNNFNNILRSYGKGS